MLTALLHVVGYIGHDYFLDDDDERVFREARGGYSRLEKGAFALSCLAIAGSAR